MVETSLGVERERTLAKLRWVLGEMIEVLKNSSLFNKLPAIGQLQQQAAELIETTGLAEKQGLSQELRPVFGWQGANHDKNNVPRTFVHSFTSPNGHQFEGRFDPLFSWPCPESAETNSRVVVEMPGARSHAYWERMEVAKERRPDVEHIQQLIECVEQWVSTARLDSQISNERESPRGQAPPLSEREQQVLDIISDQPNGKAIKGAEIIVLMRKRHRVVLEQGTLTGHIIPKLKRGYGVKNRPNVGYYREPR